LRNTRSSVAVSAIGLDWIVVLIGALDC
jgi:hypothetical protein